MALTAESPWSEEKPNSWGLAPRAPAGRWRGGAEPRPAGAALPGECGTAERAGGRRGVAVFEQGSGAITFFLLLFQVNTLPRPPLAPSTPPPSLSVPLMCFYLRAAVQTNMIGIYSPLLTFSSSL